MNRPCGLGAELTAQLVDAEEHLAHIRAVRAAGHNVGKLVEAGLDSARAAELVRTPALFPSVSAVLSAEREIAALRKRLSGLERYEARIASQASRVVEPGRLVSRVA